MKIFGFQVTKEEEPMTTSDNLIIEPKPAEVQPEPAPIEVPAVSAPEPEEAKPVSKKKGKAADHRDEAIEFLLGKVKENVPFREVYDVVAAEVVTILSKE